MKHRERKEARDEFSEDSMGDSSRRSPVHLDFLPEPFPLLIDCTQHRNRFRDATNQKANPCQKKERSSEKIL